TGLLLFSLHLGCSSDADSAGSAEKSVASAGGAATTFNELSRDVGRVLVVGHSDTLERAERAYRGRSTPAASGGDVVSCAVAATNDGVELSVLAGPAGVA